MTYGELSDNFKKWFPEGTMAQNGYALNGNWVEFKDLKITKESGAIEALVLFGNNECIVKDKNSDKELYRWINP